MIICSIYIYIFFTLEIWLWCCCTCPDVPQWLKSLRLHKYAWLFASMTYEEMLGLSEEGLESRGVTKGARHKIVLSVRKLRERQTTLTQLEQDVMKGGSLRAALEELRAILITPIKAPEPDCLEQDDLPRLFTRVIGKGKSDKIFVCPIKFPVKYYRKLSPSCKLSWIEER